MRAVASVALASLIIVVAFGLTGCVAHPTATPTSQTPTAATVEGRSTSTPVPTTLTCEDAFPGGGSVPDARNSSPTPVRSRPPHAAGLSSEGWAGSPSSFHFPVDSASAGIAFTGADGTTYGGWKAPITIGPKTAARRVELLSPPNAALVVASAQRWASGGALAGFTARTTGPYTLSSCLDRPATFPSEILVAGPACVDLRVTNAATGESGDVHVPMYGGTCT